MYNLTPHELVNKVIEMYPVEVSICKIHNNRWSNVCSSSNFLFGVHKFKLSESYGLILNCDIITLHEIKSYLKMNNFNILK